MYCNKCGSHNNLDAKFCANCGAIIDQKNNEKINEEFRNQKLNNGENNKLGLTSQIIGIISIILVFIIQIFIIPLAIVGLILGLIHKKQMNQQKFGIGIILNGISIVIAVPILLFYSNWLLNPINPVAGTWNCTTLDSKNYIFTLKLNTNNKFSYDKYGDAMNNSVKGKFEIEDLDKKNASDSYRYYNLKLTGEEAIIDGEIQKKLPNMQFEMGVGTSLSDAKGSAVLMNTSNYNTYYCYLEK